MALWAAGWANLQLQRWNSCRCTDRAASTAVIPLLPFAFFTPTTLLQSQQIHSKNRYLQILRGTRVPQYARSRPWSIQQCCWYDCWCGWYRRQCSTNNCCLVSTMVSPHVPTMYEDRLKIDRSEGRKVFSQVQLHVCWQECYKYILPCLVVPSIHKNLNFCTYEYNCIIKKNIVCNYLSYTIVIGCNIYI